MNIFTKIFVIILTQLAAHGAFELEGTDSDIPQKSSETSEISKDDWVPNVIKMLEWLREQRYALKRWSPTEKKHPVEDLNVLAIRSAILSVVTENEVLRDLFDGKSITNSMPYNLDCWYPEPWPLYSVSHMHYNPFATLGGWHIYFGNRPNESIIDPVYAEIPQSIVYKWLDYFDPDKKLVKVKNLIIDIRPDERENGSSQTISEIQVRGWYIQEYIAEDQGYSFYASSVKYTHGGGIYSNLHWIEKGEIPTTKFDIAFLGEAIKDLGDSKGR